MQALLSAMERDSRRWHGWALCWFGLLSLVLTWPLALHPHSAVLGSPDSDTMKHIWTLWWMRESVLEHGLFPFQTQLINHPVGLALYPIEPLNGLFAVLLGGLPLVLTSNLLALVNLVLTGYCGALLGRRLSSAPGAGLVTGTLLQTGALTLFTVHVGVGELQHLWWLPLGILAWLGVHQQGRKRDTLALSATLVGSTLSCFYLGFFLASSIAVLSIHRLLVDSQRIRLLGRYAIAAGLGLIVLLPVTKTFSSSYGEGEPPRIGLARYVLESGHGQPVTDPVSARLDLVELVRPARALRESSSREQLAYGGGRYLGWPLIVLIGLAAWKLRAESLPWLAVGGVGVLLATGSYFVWEGVEYSTATITRLGMPFLFMNRALGYLVEPVNFPSRFLALTLLSGSVLAALLTQHRFRGHSLASPVLALAILNAVDVQLHQLISRPMASFAMTDYAALTATETTGGAILDLNLTWRADPETRGAAQIGQIIHSQPIQGVPIERVEQYADEGQVFAKNLPMVAVLEPAFKFQRTVVLDTQRHTEDLALLRDAGFDRILLLGVGTDNAVAPALVTALHGLLGPPTIADRRSVLFNIPDPTVEPDVLAGWKADHERRIETWWGRQEGSMGRPLR